MSERTDKPALTVEQVAEWLESEAKMLAKIADQQTDALYITRAEAQSDYARDLAAAIRKGELP